VQKINNGNGKKSGQQSNEVIIRAHGQTKTDNKQNKSQVARIFDGGAETNERKSAKGAKSTGQTITDNHHNNSQENAD